jgi:hypothetical protein
MSERSFCRFGTRATRLVGEKIAQIVAQSIFVKINTRILPCLKVLKNFGLHLQFEIAAQCQQ